MGQWSVAGVAHEVPGAGHWKPLQGEAPLGGGWEAAEEGRALKERSDENVALARQR